MASEIRVNKINSSTGVGTITLSPTGVDISGITTVSTLKVGTGLTASEDGDIFFTGVCTATTFAGSGANLTSLPAAQLTGTVADARFPATLPAVSAANLTNVPAANITGTLPAIDGSNLTGIGGTDFIHAEQISVSGVTTSQAFIPSQGQLSHRNIIINGAMTVAQRATSSTSTGYQTVDRFQVAPSGLDENPTQAQVDVSSGTTPYTLGFRKAYKLTNGNQTSGAGAADNIRIIYQVEAQDLANSGWNYLSSSSYITLSFWVKSSVAQNFNFQLRSKDGTSQSYAFETGSLTADTWTKITKTIPGNSNLTFNNDSGSGMEINFWLFAGTDYTDSGVSLNAWAAYAGGTRTPDQTSTWYTTNDATFELTGVQLEVGPVATPFEHRTFGEELHLCKRYYEVLVSGTGIAWGGICAMYTASETHHQCTWVEKRATPTLTYTEGSTYYRYYGNGTNVTANRPNGMLYASTRSGGIQTNSTYLSGSLLQGGAAFAYSQNADTHVAVDAEL